jgi:predicted AAA+ superfamily ATPase
MSQLYIRQQRYDALWKNLMGEPRLLQVVVGPRQVGKTTIAKQLLEHWLGPKLYETADQPHTPGTDWITHHWEKARQQTMTAGQEGLLVLDEIQKIPHWSEIVKKLADEDRFNNTHLRVLLLGSSALLFQRGLTESLAGRFELHRHVHWSFKECHDYFGLSLEEYFLFGGYPGALLLRKDPIRWSHYIRDTLIETVIGKDMLLMSPVQKPALLRQTFGIACMHPAEILSYQKMIGQLSDAGNATTIAHYFDLLSAAFLIAPLSRWSGSRIRQKASSPKIIVRDNSLSNALAFPQLYPDQIDARWRGRLVENSVGAALVSLADQQGSDIFYWRERSDEVDYVIRFGRRLMAMEVKSGENHQPLKGLSVFKRHFKDAELIVIGGPEQQEKSIKHFHLLEFFQNPLIIFQD